MGKLRMPIGIDDFGKLRSYDFYYVDKTGMIKELLENWGEVNLFTRPRRFGKSMNMSMLKCFFEIGGEKSLFNGLAISKETALCEEYMGKYPVISLSLKDVKGQDYSSAISRMWSIVSMETNRLNMLYNLSESNNLDQSDKGQLLGLRTKSEDLESSIRTLSYLLYKHCGKPCIVLIDEYDVPLQKANEANYYRPMVNFISSFFSLGMKSNNNIFFAVVTGCLRIAKESIFTGFNNPKMHTIADEQYEEWFGFTDSEVKEMLAYYGKSDLYDLTREWYDGYLFGDRNVYCPWDVINWCDQIDKTSNQIPQNFWENTSGNEMISRFAELADSDTRDEIGMLIEGGTVKKKLRFDITYSELDDNIDNLWSVLFSTGYLTQHGRDEDGRYELAIPNKEVTDIFKNKVDLWFRERVLNDRDALNDFYEALDSEDAEALENCLLDYMADTISYHDGGTSDDKENFPTGKAISKGSEEQSPRACFYHGLLIGMLGHRNGWIVKSGLTPTVSDSRGSRQMSVQARPLGSLQRGNREGGNGRPDIVTYPKRTPIHQQRFAIIIEVKYSKREADLKADARDALDQIEHLKYDNYFGSRKPDKIVHYGIAFYMKECRVLKE